MKNPERYHRIPATRHVTLYGGLTPEQATDAILTQAGNPNREIITVHKGDERIRVRNPHTIIQSDNKGELENLHHDLQTADTVIIRS